MGNLDRAGFRRPIEIPGKGAWTVVGSLSWLIVLSLLVLSFSGCASFRAAQFYQSGTQALDRGDSETAIRDLEAAEALAPEVSEIQNHLGLAYLDAGRLGEARLAFARAVELDCENDAAQRNLDAVRRATSVRDPRKRSGK